MAKTKKSMLKYGIAAICVIIVLVIAKLTTTAESVQSSFWALVPPILAIALALVTKEVYSSLFIGILSGALLYSGFNFEGTLHHVMDEGIVSQLADAGNVGILIFLVLLGTLVAMMNKAGGSAAFGRWAQKHIKTRAGAQIATIVLGMLIFIDDYFNCLTVGSVMRPVTDKHGISRAKLAYLIDATAAPICIIAPVSSWAAAVSDFAADFSGDVSGLQLFIRAIPFNFYALLTIVMMFALVFIKADFGPMAIHERNAMNGDIFTTGNDDAQKLDEQDANPRGRVIDLILPVAVLIVACVIAMIYTGGFFGGDVSFIEAFADSDATVGLAYGALAALIFTVIYYMCRRVLNFEDCMGCLPEGFKAMVPAILILTLAWSLNGVTKSLGAAPYVENLIKQSADGFVSFLPAIIFLVALGLAFATGTSWGTFGILIPIVLGALQSTPDLMIVAMSACMAGAVCGDHCSPISDTTIMASAGAQCNHVNHVSTQLPYALVCAGVSFVTYIVAGFSRSAWISLPVGIVLMIALLLLVKYVQSKRANNA
ncbi:MAG: Na+/H+ antiporter NhaC family protein [Clostridia bacterium]|nr:Na+/H+ antiporter NhaC family protein [Clostridia bacterium]